MSVAEASVRMEKVGSAIISPFPEVMHLMLALLVLMIVLPVLPPLAHVVWANACFCLQFRGCCAAKESSQGLKHELWCLCTPLCAA